MGAVVEVAVWAAAVAWALYLYDVLVSLAGFWPLPRPPRARREARFAVLICAHDEERVVEGVVRSLAEQDYPRDRVTIFVVADHCTDRTAEVARAAGAIALERQASTGRTKGYALQWGMARVMESGDYDAVCVFDADNRVAPDFLATMDDYLAAGHVAIQAYLDTKNPNDTWVTRSIALAYYVTNRFWMRPRARLGLAATLGGTGFCLAWPIARKYEWDPGSLADDLELTMKLVLAGIDVSYCPHTRTFDEKPVTLRQSLRQRSRWMQGHNDVALRWVLPMLFAALRRPSIRCLDAVFHLLQPARMLVAFAALAALGVAKASGAEVPALVGAFEIGWAAGALFALVFVVYPLVVAAAEGAFWFALRNFVPFVVLSFTWLPAIVWGLVFLRRRVWVHTSHGAAPSPPAASAPEEPTVRT